MVLAGQPVDEGSVLGSGAHPGCSQEGEVFGHVEWRFWCHQDQARTSDDSQEMVKRGDPWLAQERWQLEGGRARQPGRAHVNS